VASLHGVPWQDSYVSRNERLLVVFAGAFLVGIVSLIAFGSTWLNGQGWFGGAANVVQLVSAPATLAAVVTFLYMRWTHRCATARCIRLGEHPVDGTLRKVCHRHHTLEHHRLAYELHRIEGMLGWGESHTTKGRKR
jgi:hypothetical protein